MKKEVDFIFRYEHKVRELETIMLLRLELERRGYSVAFVGNYDYKQKIKYKPKVLVSPAIYSDVHLKGDFLRYGKMKKIVNLLWEQVFTMGNESDPNFSQNVVGIGARALNLCWGDQSKKRLVDHGANPRTTIIVGQINQDLFKGKFRKVLKTKEELAYLYGLDSSKNWQLFISSFAFCDMDELQVSLFIKNYGQEYYNNFKKYSDNCREVILDWFGKALENDSSTIIIYRPHPDEAAKSQLLKLMQKKYKNFVVISELAIKHWVNACEKTLNWYSTGIIDAIILDKPWRLLRPFKLEKQYDYRYMYSAKQITTFESFISDFYNYDKKEIVDNELIHSYYHISKEGFVYKTVCDLMEELYRSDKNDIQYTTKENLKFSYFFVRVLFLRICKRIISILLPKTLFVRFMKAVFKNRYKIEKILEEGYEKNVINESDLNDIDKRIRPIVYGE